MKSLPVTSAQFTVPSTQSRPDTGIRKLETGAAGLGGEAARLRETAKQLEAIFVEQLFKAMRETVPEGGMVDGGSGEEIFSGLLDSHLAAQVPAQWNDGLSDALVRQLRGRMQDDAGADTPHTATPRGAETL